MTAGDAYEPAGDHKLGDGEGWREGVEGSAIERLSPRLGGERKLPGVAALDLRSGGSSCRMNTSKSSHQSSNWFLYVCRGVDDSILKKGDTFTHLCVITSRSGSSLVQRELFLPTSPPLVLG